MDPSGALIFDKYAKSLFQPNMLVLEIGPENIPSIHERLVDDKSIHFDYLDIVERGGGCIFSEHEYEYPLESDTYDIVLSSMVMEHVRMPWRWMPELARITNPGGHVITVVPVNWEYHCWPVDCWRVFGEGLKALYEDAGLRTLLAVSEELLDGIIHTLGVAVKEEG